MMLMLMLMHLVLRVPLGLISFTLSPSVTYL